MSDHYSHKEIENLFLYADAPGDAPDGSKVAKTQEWLIRCNKTENTNPLNVLGKLLESYMETEFPVLAPWEKQSPYHEEWQVQRDRIQTSLAKHGLSYSVGGRIHKKGRVGATRSLEQILLTRDLVAVDAEFKRTMDNIESDPPASLTGACAIVEALCKAYIKEEQLDLPKEQTIKPLWNVVKKNLGLNPEHIEDQDLLKVLSGLSSIVDGLGALRTHAGSAHGRSSTCYRLEPRHVRLAVHSAHTLVTFLIETWEAKRKRTTA